MYEGAEALAREASQRHELSGYYGEGGRDTASIGRATTCSGRMAA
jgi:hypothetical protein